MMLLNSDDAGREIRAVLNNLGDEFDPVKIGRLECFARGYLAHAENHDDFMDQCCYFDGYDIFFDVFENGWITVITYPSSYETGTDWANGYKLFSVRRGVIK